MALTLQEFGLPLDICLMIEKINYEKYLQYKILPELINIFDYHWRKKFKSYEDRFYTGFTKDRFGNCHKYFTHEMHITRQSQRNSSYHMIYNDHFHIVKLQDKMYKKYYINRKRKLLYLYSLKYFN